MGRSPLALMERLQRSYPDAATVDLAGGRKLVFVFAPRLVGVILGESARNFSGREFNKAFQHVENDGLPNLEDLTHRQHRMAVQPALAKPRIDDYVNVVRASTEELLATWRDGAVKDIAREMQSLTLRAVTLALFRFDLGLAGAQALGDAFADVVSYSGEQELSWRRLLRLDLPMTAFGRYRRAAERVAATADMIIRQSGERATRGGSSDKADVVGLLLAAQSTGRLALDDGHLRDHVTTFLSAGHKTTANSLSWFFHVLSTAPAVTERLRVELRTVLDGRAATAARLGDLEYLEMCLKETMRLYPANWALGRRALQDFALEGYYLPAGQMIMLSQWITHRLPSVWGDDALVFRPERFDSRAPQPVPPFAYFPFGWGHHACLGKAFALMEASVIIATLLTRVDLQAVAGHPVVPDPLVPPQPRFGLPMRIKMLV